MVGGHLDPPDRGYIFCKPHENSLERKIIDLGGKVFETSGLSFRRKSSINTNVMEFIGDQQRRMSRLNSISLSQRSAIQSNYLTSQGFSVNG